MRKVIKIILTISLLLSTLFEINAYAVDQKVYDEADLFSVTEKEALQMKASDLSQRIMLDIVILTIDDNKGKTTSDYADDFYDENGFGYGENYDGLILLINLDDRDVYISTLGKAIKYFTDDRIDSILDKVYIFLSEENYGDGADTFLDEVEYYVQKGVPSNQHSYDENTGISTKGNINTSTSQKESLINRLLIYLLISIGIGGVSVGIMALNNKGKTITNQNTYLDSNSFKLITKLDRHVNTSVTFVRINTDSGSKGGRSTTHRSSSGRSHGGGGRKF
ncbi:MAG: TPM domain-containing protein [Tissierellales bacterium]